MADFHSRLGILPDYEHILECCYRSLVSTGDTVVDVGAHTGRHTEILADLVGSNGRVLAFEPLPQARRVLEARRLGSQVRVFDCALADFVGKSSFVHARGTPEESGLRRKVYNRPDLVDPKEIEVEVRKLDDFLSDLAALAFVKIDAEGAEILCLRGASAALERFRPFVSVEYGRPSYSAYGNEPRTLFDVARSFGYIVGDLFGAVCADLAEWETVCDFAYWDWFLVPEERLDEWRTRLRSWHPQDGAGLNVHTSKTSAPRTGMVALTAEIASLRAENTAMKASASWRITRPLRVVKSALMRGVIRPQKPV
ncbi:MAG: FkbM family methyltransferase [Acetobacteraceae bacterium]|jgi:FkbM family methyltransferase